MFSFLICEDKQLQSQDGAGVLYSTIIFMTLSGRVYGLGHTTAVRERGTVGIGCSLPYCFINII